jgi:hypothetical protein
MVNHSKFVYRIREYTAPNGSGLENAIEVEEKTITGTNKNAYITEPPLDYDELIAIVNSANLCKIPLVSLVKTLYEFGADKVQLSATQE